jgi:hypothetical protein
LGLCSIISILTFAITDYFFSRNMADINWVRISPWGSVGIPRAHKIESTDFACLASCHSLRNSGEEAYCRAFYYFLVFRIEGGSFHFIFGEFSGTPGGPACQMLQMQITFEQTGAGSNCIRRSAKSS